MRRYPLFAACLAAPIAPGLPALAGDLDLDLVSARASWVVHLDVEGLRGSEIGGAILDQVNMRADAEFDQAMGALGVDPVRDLESVTLYGSTEAPEKGVVIVETTADVEGVLAGLEKMSEGELEHETSRFDGLVIHQLGERGDDPLYMHVDHLGGSRSRVIAAPVRGLLLHALGVAGGEFDSMGRDGELFEGRRLRNGGFLTVAATDLEELDGGPQSLAYRKAERLFFQAGEDDGRFFATVAFSVPTDEEAHQLSQVAMGAIALGQMFAASDPEAAKFAEFIQAVRVETDDSTVSVSFEQDVDRLMQRLEELDVIDWEEMIERGEDQGWWTNGR